MTIERVGNDEGTQEYLVFCTRFEEVGKGYQLQRERLNPIVLDKYEPPAWSVCRLSSSVHGFAGAAGTGTTFGSS